MHKLKTKSTIKIKAIAGVVAILSLIGASVRIITAFASASDYQLTGATVDLNGTDDGTAYVNFTTTTGGTFYGYSGDFSFNETNDTNGYIYLQDLSNGGCGGNATKLINVDFGRMICNDSGYVGAEIGGGGTIMGAIYVVDKDTPAGTYAVTISGATVTGGTSGFGGENVPTLTANITVTRPNEQETKPEQEIVFYDANHNDITGTTVNKKYGDDAFVVTYERTVGDGEVSYHPDDDDSSPHVATTAGEFVNVENVGSVNICAWASETENYRATTRCFTVNVSKRPLTISGASVNNKTYDGNPSAEVTSVSFSDRNLNNEDYTATASFDNANAGNGKSVTVSVTLSDEAEQNYALNPTTYNTTANISKYELASNRVSLAQGSEYEYAGTQIQPEVLVQAHVNNGDASLVEGQDYTRSYCANVNVGTGCVRITGIGNYSTAESQDGWIEKEFSITEHTLSEVDYVSGPDAMIVGGTINKSAFVLRTSGGRTLVMDTDYTISVVGEGGNVGENVTVTFEGINNQDGSFVKNIPITDKLTQTVSFNDVENGATVEATFGDTGIVHTATTSGDGTISYTSSNEAIATVNNAGEVTILKAGNVTITALASGTDTYAPNSAVYALAIEKKTVSVQNIEVGSKVYDGTNSATVESIQLSDGLVNNTDYRVQSATFSGVNVGNYENGVTVTVVLDESSWDKYQFDSTGATISSVYTSASITAFAPDQGRQSTVLNETSFVYTGDENRPTATVRVDLDGDGSFETTLTAGTDYDMRYFNNVNVGTATANVVAKGNYNFSVLGLSFSITAASVENVEVSAPAQNYTGSALEPVLTVTGIVNGESVTFTNNDYAVAAHEDFVNAGDHAITVGFKEGSNYNIPTTNGTFMINKIESNNPVEMTAGLEIEAGKTLAELGERTSGFNWVNSGAIVSEGLASYDATYVQNNDTTNYFVKNVQVPVYGLKRISVLTTVNDGGEVTSPGNSAIEGDELIWTIMPDEGYELKSFFVNDRNLTSQVSNGQIKVTAGTEDITAIVMFRRVHNIIKTNGVPHTRGIDGTAEFEIDADYELFEDDGEVYIDGELVSSENYDSWSASTVISLKADYMDSLTSGEHQLTVVFSDDGVARASFTVVDLVVENSTETDNVEKNPATADTGRFTMENGGAIAATGAVVAGVVMASVVGFVYLRKFRK